MKHIARVPKIVEPSIWLPVSHTKPIDTLYWNQYLLTAGNYKSARGELQNSGWLQINTVNGAMSITINRVINQVIMITQTCLKILCFHKSKLRNFYLGVGSCGGLYCLGGIILVGGESRNFERKLKLHNSSVKIIS